MGGTAVFCTLKAPSSIVSIRGWYVVKYLLPGFTGSAWICEPFYRKCLRQELSLYFVLFQPMTKKAPFPFLNVPGIFWYPVFFFTLLWYKAHFKNYVANYSICILQKRKTFCYNIEFSNILILQSKNINCLGSFEI